MIASFEVTETSPMHTSHYAHRVECILSDGSKFVLTGKGNNIPSSLAKHQANVYLSWQLWHDITGTFAITENITIPRLEAYLLAVAARNMAGEHDLSRSYPAMEGKLCKI